MNTRHDDKSWRDLSETQRFCGVADERLLPCAFCGGKARLYYNGNDESGVWYVSHRCADSGPHMSMSSWTGGSGQESKAAAIEAWNRRAPRSADRPPEGWRAVLANVRLGLGAGSRNPSNTEYEIEHGGAMLDHIEERLEAAEAAPTTEEEQCPICGWVMYENVERSAGAKVPIASSVRSTEPNVLALQVAALRQQYAYYRSNEAAMVHVMTALRAIDLDALLNAVNSATSSSKDEARLSWLDTLLRHCPHADLTYNDDDDGMDGPQGFSLIVESCSRMELHAPTLADLIDLGMSTKPDEDGNVEATEGAAK